VAVTLASTPAGSPLVTVEGMWPTPCLPDLGDVRLDGFELRIEARAQRGICARYPMPFHFEIDLVARLGWPLAGGVYRVGFFAANGNAAPLEQRGFGLVEISGEASLTPESGFWWPAAGDEQGSTARGTALSIDLHNDIAAIAVLAYDALGAPAWFLGSGRLEGRHLHADLFGMRDGADLFGAGERPPAVAANLSVDIEFASSNRAQAWIGRYEQGGNQPVLNLRELSITRAPLAAAGADAWLGEWVLVADDASPPQRLNLRELQGLDAETSRLVAAEGPALVCRHAGARATTLPQSCLLLDAQGSELAGFTSVGLQRCVGSTPAGTSVRLLRVR